MKSKVAFALLLLALMTLTACVNNSQPGPTPTTAPTNTLPPAATPTGTAVAPAGGTITFETSGGIAGIQRRMVVAPDGTVTLSGRGTQTATLKLSQERVDGLLSELIAADFRNLEDRYGDGTVSDDIYYTISYEGGDVRKSVEVESVGGKDVTPQPLLDLIDELVALEREVGIQGSSTPGTSTTPSPSTPGGTPTGTGSGDRFDNGTITYQVLGGVAGLNSTLTIQPNGAATYFERGELAGSTTLSQEVMARLREQMAAAGFLRLRDKYEEIGTVSDEIYHTIVFTAPGVSKSVVVAEMTGRKLAPQSLLTLLDLLPGIAEDVRTDPTPSSTP
jgi:hypothetical protein